MFFKKKLIILKSRQCKVFILKSKIFKNEKSTLFINSNFWIFFGQEIPNFSVNNNQLEWQQVYEYNSDSIKIKELVKSIGKFKIENISDFEIIGRFENLSLDYKGAGYSTGFTPGYILNSTLKGFFKIELKDNKYRVTVNDIVCKPSNDLNFGNLSLMRANADIPVEEMALKKESFRKGFVKTDSKIFNYTLKNLFEFSKYKKINDNW